jgi:alcohol dehydrogenase
MTTALHSASLNTQRLTIGTGAKTVFGAGTIGELSHVVKALGGTRAFLVTDAGLVASGLIARVQAQLVDAGLEVDVYAELRANPASEDVAAGARALRRHFGHAIVVGLGGGTSLDGAKGIALAAANDVTITELDYRNEPANPGLPVIAVPTTAGTGSETNSFAVIEDHEAHRKFYIGHASVAPRAVILDPELTMGLPPGATGATGMDALTHALESLMARNPNPFSHGLDLEVVRMVHRWLPIAMESGDDLEARAQMLLAAHLAGLAFANTGLGLAHALGHTLSALLGTPHGVALAVVLPSVMELNLEARSAQLAEVGALLGADPIDEVCGLRARLRMPSTLAELGLTEAMVDRLVQGALDDVVLANNPIQPSPEELGALVRSLL